MMVARMQDPVLVQPQQNQGHDLVHSPTANRLHQQQQDQSLGQRTASGDNWSAIYEYSGLSDEREVVWPKLQVLKEKYLQDLEQLYGLLSTVDSRALNPEHVRKLNHYKDVVRRMLTYLRVARERLPVEFKQDLLEIFAKQIVMVIEVFKRKPETSSLNATRANSSSSLSGNTTN